MEKMVKVRAMKRVYYEPEGRPDKGKLYLEGQEFMCEESRISDYDKPVKGVRGQVRGCMRRLDREVPAAAPTANGKKG